MIIFPNAKINIGLFVERKREDGYHDIQSIFYPVDCADVIEYEESSDFTLRIEGLKVDASMEDNLVYKSWKLLNDRFGIPAQEVRLLKSIPMGAGLGGGSADASVLFKSLIDQYELKIAFEEQATMLATLGSDCPFFLRNEASLVSGRGEYMTKHDLNLEGLYGLLVNPGIHSSTKEAYQGIALEPDHFDLSMLEMGEIDSWKGYLKNSFESSIFKLHPAIESLKSSMYDQGALYASMTGSGSSVFGIFEALPSKNNFESYPYLRQFKF